MVIIGLKRLQKQREIQKYIDNNKDIDKVFIFQFDKDMYEYKLKGAEVRYIEYSEIQMYRTFYPLLETINKNSLVVADDIMRTQVRNNLDYNCFKKYMNQTEHRLVFNYLPFIDNKENFMILLDFNTPDKYKLSNFDYNLLQVEDVRIKPVRFKLNWINIETTEKQKEKYEEKKNNLFDTIGTRDPNIIPRELQLLAGNFKKDYIEADKMYVARNKRFKLDNVKNYNDIFEKGDYIIIDKHYRMVNFIDFLRRTEMTTLNFLVTDLSIDRVIMKEIIEWKARLDSIYAKANLYR